MPAPWDTTPWGSLWSDPSFPALAVEVAWAVNPLITPSAGDWDPITTWVREIGINQGRQHELSRTDAGTLAVTLNNEDRRFDPSDVASPYYPNVTPMRRIRVRATFAGTTYDLFQGFIESWPNTWEDVAEVHLGAVDAFKLLNLFDLTAYSNEVLADAPLAYWRLREMTGTTALDEGGNSGGPLNGTYTGSFTLNQAGPLYGGSGAAWLTNASNGNVIIGNVAALNLAGDLTI